MTNFLENTFAELNRAADRVVLREVRGEEFVSVSGKQLLEQVAGARAFIRRHGLRAGDRCALLGPNSITWAAIDLALMAEGVIVVPLYSRQAAAELAVMLRDSGPKLLFVGEGELGEAVAQVWPDAPPRVLFSEAIRSELAPAPGFRPRRIRETMTTSSRLSTLQELRVSRRAFAST